MVKINPQIFKAYDIRGTDLNEEIAWLIGKGFGTYCKRLGSTEILVGRDTRNTSKPYQDALETGLLSTGCNVYDIGVTLSSAILFSRSQYKKDSSIYVTASHNPANYNGFKMSRNFEDVIGEDIQEIKKIIESQNFESGNGERSVLAKSNEHYYQAIKKKIKLKKPLKVVADYGNGTAAVFMPKFLEDLGCQVWNLFENIDPSFPNHIPDPVNLSSYKDLVNKVNEVKADVGLMFDGDGDRVGFVDEKGQIWLGDTILILLAKNYLPNYPGRTVMIELKNSEAVYEEVARLGGKPIFWKTGHAFLGHKVKEEKAILCGEMSCHYWITPGWYEFDDSIHAASDVLRIISESDKSFSEMMAEIPRYPVTPEYRISIPEEKKFQIVAELTNYFKDKCDKALTIDGIRGYKYDGWFLLRASNTQPILVFRAESKTQEGLEKIKSFVKSKIDEYPEINLDWNRQYESV